MAKVTIYTKAGVKKDSFECDIDPESAEDALKILRRSRFPDGEIRVQQKRGPVKKFRSR